MRYKINNTYIIVNGESISVGTVLGKEDKPHSCCPTEIVTNSEYEEGVKCFKYGKQQINNLVCYCVGEFVNYVAKEQIKQKWIDELAKMGYDTSVLKYEI